MKSFSVNFDTLCIRSSTLCLEFNKLCCIQCFSIGFHIESVEFYNLCMKSNPLYFNSKPLHNKFTTLYVAFISKRSVCSLQHSLCVKFSSLSI